MKLAHFVICFLITFSAGDSERYSPVRKVDESSSKCLCGISEQVPNTSRIIGGSPVTESSEYSWHAMIRRRFKFICNGALISQRYVVTVASCFYSKAGKLYPNYLLNVGVGITKLFNNKLRDPSFIGVQEIVIHSQYKPKSFKYNIYYNIALVKLKNPVKDNQIPLCLPLHYTSKDYLGQTATVTGWGKSHPQGPTHNVLQEVTLKIQKKCYSSFQESETSPVDSIICTSKNPNKNVCMGDKGNPMMVDKKHEKILVGLFILDKDCRFSEAKFTSVSFYLNWILQNVNEDSECFNIL
ncbi:Serine protease 44 [Armadillidium vulgare]|nr:Serine protease 44 [Armadillidium vulgare]